MPPLVLDLIRLIQSAGTAVESAYLHYFRGGSGEKKGEGKGRKGEGRGGDGKKRKR